MDGNSVNMEKVGVGNTPSVMDVVAAFNMDRKRYIEFSRLGKG